MSRMLRLGIAGMLLCCGAVGAVVVSGLPQRPIAQTDGRQASETLYNCGVECICYVAAYSEKALSADEIRHEASDLLDPTGRISLEDLRKLCLRVGFTDPRTLKADCEDLDALPMPLIAHIQSGGTEHFVVCAKANRSAVQVIDTFSRKSAVSNVPRKVFDKWFTGYVLTIGPQ